MNEPPYDERQPRSDVGLLASINQKKIMKMELTLKEMAQIERAKVEAAKKEEERIYNERMARLTKMRDDLLDELKEFIPGATKGRYVRPSVFIPLKGFEAKSGYGYDIFPLECGSFEVKKNSNSCCLKDSWSKGMNRKQLAEQILSQYV